MLLLYFIYKFKTAEHREAYEYQLQTLSSALFMFWLCNAGKCKITKCSQSVHQENRKANRLKAFLNETCLVKIDNQTFNFFCEVDFQAKVRRSLQRRAPVTSSFLFALNYSICPSKRNFFAVNSPISTVLTVEYLLEVILSIYLFKKASFLSENGM